MASERVPTIIPTSARWIRSGAWMHICPPLHPSGKERPILETPWSGGGSTAREARRSVVTYQSDGSRTPRYSRGYNSPRSRPSTVPTGPLIGSPFPSPRGRGDSMGSISSAIPSQPDAKANLGLQEARYPPTPPRTAPHGASRSKGISSRLLESPGRRDSDRGSSTAGSWSGSTRGTEALPQSPTPKPNPKA